MLLLTFRAAGNLYAVDVARVVEVVPRVDLRRLPHAPEFIAGVFDYRGTVVPVIDLGIRLGSDRCRDRLSTRIILVDSRPADREARESKDDTAARDFDQEPAVRQRRRQAAAPWLLGLIAEQVSDVASVKPEQVISTSMQLPQAPYLGAIVDIDHQMIQLMATDKILDDSLRRAFFGAGPGPDRASAPGGNDTGEAEVMSGPLREIESMLSERIGLDPGVRGIAAHPQGRGAADGRAGAGVAGRLRGAAGRLRDRAPGPDRGSGHPGELVLPRRGALPLLPGACPRGLAGATRNGRRCAC